MSSYYYFDNHNLPVLEEELIKVLLKIVKKQGLKISEKMIMEELEKGKNRKRKKRYSRKRTNLYIDGTNFFAGQNELFGPKKFLYFPSFLKEANRLFSIDRIYFYASYMSKLNLENKESKALISVEAQFYRQVKSTPKAFFYKGHRSPTSGKEKGVDVHLAVDVVKDAFLERYDQVVIMTGDADLIYPLQIVKRLGIPVHALFLPNRFSLEMAYRVDSAIVFNYKNKFQFSKRKLPKHLKVVNIKSPVCKHTG